jgi:hypothetical protein
MIRHIHCRSCRSARLCAYDHVYSAREGMSRSVSSSVREERRQEQGGTCIRGWRHGAIRDQREKAAAVLEALGLAYHDRHT